MVSPEDRHKAVKLIDDLLLEYKFPIAKICRILNLSTATYYRWKQNPEGLDGRTTCIRPPSKIALSLSEQDAVIKRFNQADVRDLTPEQAVLELLNKGEYLCSASTVRRIFAKHGIDGTSRRDNVRNCTHRGYRPEELVASKPNTVWSWDGTPLKNSWGQPVFMTYAIIDIYSRKIVHIDVFDSDCAENAVKFLGDALKKNHIQRGTLTLHSDNGSAMRASKTEEFLRLHGVVTSHSRPRVSNDNAFSESFFSTFNIRMGVDKRRYKSTDECRKYVQQRAEEYNNRYHSGIGFCTPNARHACKDQEQLDRRKETIQKAFTLNPKRWFSGKTRKCQRAGVQYLNPSDKPNKG